MIEGEMTSDNIMMICWDFKYFVLGGGGGALNSTFAVEGLAIYILQGIVLRNFL